MIALLGADPEVFVQSKGQTTTVVGKLGGTKDRPLPVAAGAVQEDNVLAEFNIEPAASESEWIHNLTLVMQQLDHMLNSKECSIEIKSSYNFDEGVLFDAGKQALEFGCCPDFNAWDRCKNPVPNSSTLRTAGGHIHVGLDSINSLAKAAELAKKMDLFLGVPSVLMDRDKQRRKLYGKAGSFRDKPYGMEYRSLSNFWIASPELMSWAYRQTHRAIDFTGEVDPKVKHAINSHSIKRCLELVDEYNLEVLC